MTNINLLDLQFDSMGETTTIRNFFKDLLRALWREGEEFSGKRPFGNSGWQADVYIALIKSGLIEGKLDDDGWLEDVDERAADKFIIEQIIDKL